VAALRALMRAFSYLFHGLLTLFLLAISIVALSSGQSLQLEMLPWQGRTLTWWLLGAALGGLASVILAIVRKWRALFFLWSLAALAVMARGFFFSHYYFAGPPEFHRALYLTGGALIAALGAWFPLRREPLR
jgi:sulfite exporter TauE/SafE